MSKEGFLPTTEEELQAYISEKNEEIRKAEKNVVMAKETALLRGRLSRPVFGAKDIDDATLATACRELTVRHLLGLLCDAAAVGFCLPLEFSNFNDKTFAEVIYVLQQEHAGKQITQDQVE